MSGYEHPATKLERLVTEHFDGLPILPMRRLDYLDQCEHDVAADANLAKVEVHAEGDMLAMVMDPKTAAVVMYGVRLLLANTDAHALEVRMVADMFPPDSYGRANRLEIATRHERIARRLRVLDTAYRDATDKAYWGF